MADGTRLTSQVLVIASGLNAPLLTRCIQGIDVDPLPEVFYCKGNYFTLSGKAPFSRLIYPVPDPALPFLGVHLTRMIDGGPGMVLDPRCTTLRKGFNGRYRYERMKTSGSARYRDRPVKDAFSHPHDALQYLCMRVRNGLRPARARSIVHASSKGWT